MVKPEEVPARDRLRANESSERARGEQPRPRVLVVDDEESTTDLVATALAVTVEVSDDGVGGAAASGSGLRGLADRVEALDGRLYVASPAGGGTTIRAEIPCAS